MRGRKPLPNVVKLLRASQRLNPDEPRPQPAAAEPPAGLSVGARRVWAECVPELARLGVFTVIDVGRMARTCELEAIGRRELGTVRRAKGTQRRAALLTATKAFEVADRVLAQFGIGAPAERARLRTPPREEDKLARFKAKHRA